MHQNRLLPPCSRAQSTPSALFSSCTRSFYPQGLNEVLITGGLAPLAAGKPGCSAAEVYARLFPRSATQTAKLYKCAHVFAFRARLRSSLDRRALPPARINSPPPLRAAAS